MPEYTIVQTEIPPCRLELQRAREQGLDVTYLEAEVTQVSRQAILVDGLLRATLDGQDTRFWVGRLLDGRPPITPGPANDPPPGGLALVGT